IYVVVLIPVLALALQRVSRFRVALLFAVVAFVGCAVTLPVFAPHPFPQLLQQLDQNAIKLRYISAAVHPQWTLSALAVLVSCVAFLRRMDLPRLFLIFSFAS